MASGGLILVVEDAREIRAPLCALLEEEGYEVQSAANGRDALELLRASSVLPNVVILDLSMPFMDGREFLTILRSDPGLAALPVLVASGDTGSVVPEATQIVRKPYQVTELLGLIAHFRST